MPFEDADVPGSSCYVMPIMLERDGRQAEVSGAPARAGHPDEHLLPVDPPLHAPTASAFPIVSLPITELASRTELTLPVLSRT